MYILDQVSVVGLAIPKSIVLHLVQRALGVTSVRKCDILLWNRHISKDNCSLSEKNDVNLLIYAKILKENLNE